MHGVFLDAFEIAKYAAIAAQTRSFRMPAFPALRMTRHLDLWRQEPSFIVAASLFTPFDVTWMPAMLHLLSSFRSRAGVSLDPRLLRTWDDLAPSTRQALEPAVDPATWPALQQLLNSFRAQDHVRLQPQLQQYIQSLDWIREPLDLEDQEVQIVRQLLTMLVGR